MEEHNMMGITHATLATGAAAIIWGPSPALILAAIGALLPDLDSSRSILGQILWPVSHWLEDHFPHRGGPSHSLFTTGILVLPAIGAILLGQPAWWCAFALGHGVSSVSDTLTKQGCQLLWPVAPYWCVWGLNPKRRLKTGGQGEMFILFGATATVAIALSLQGIGGAIADIQLAIQPAHMTYLQIAAKGQPWIEIERGWTATGEPISGVFPLVGQRLILTEQGAIALGPEGQENITAGEALTELTVSANDEPMTLPPGIVTGTVTIDSPDLITQTPTGVTLTGQNLSFEYLPSMTAAELLRDQWVTGSLTIIQLNP